MYSEHIHDMCTALTDDARLQSFAQHVQEVEDMKAGNWSWKDLGHRRADSGHFVLFSWSLIRGMSIYWEG